MGYTAPVWVSEFGDWHDGRNLGGGHWWPSFISYLEAGDLDWGYWRVDGTESRGSTRTFDAEAGFGIFNTSWSGPAADGIMLGELQVIQGPTLGPGVNSVL